MLAPADLENVGRKRLADAFGERRRGQVVGLHQHRKAVLAKACGHGFAGRRFGRQDAAQALGDRFEQCIGRVQADFLQQALVVVGFEQQQAVLALVVGDAGDSVLQRAQEGGTVEQAGDLVALAQLLDLAREFRVGFLASEHDLQARFAFVHGGRELHDRGEIVAFDVARLQLVTRRRRFALAQRLEQLLEAVDVLRRDEVEQRHPLDIVERLVAEHLQVRAVGADVHAFMDVRDRLARGFDQCVAAALGFAHLGFEPSQRAARLEVRPLVAYRAKQLLGLVAQGNAPDAAGERLAQAGLVHAVGNRDDWQILAAGLDQLRDLIQRNAVGLQRGEHQVDGLRAEHRAQFLGRRRA